MQLGWLTAENPPPNDPVVYLKKLYFDTALSASPHNLRSLQELADPSHIVYGSDYPFAPETVTQMTNEGLHSYDGFDEKSLSLLYKKNVIQLFPRFKTMGKAPLQNQI
jgi:predicted TIM-barrel fold metal-dependent hydrolase